MGRIVHLDQNLINMIAAGEVIDRPCSVVKELLENSIDSGATKIRISIEDGGRKLIRITDNGCGMDADDLEAAFQTHSTSKIKTHDDLDIVSTLGFRGEALASIASVSQVTAFSRVTDNLSGHLIEIDCGQKKPVAPYSCDYGTTIEVRNIFYKLPARRKFLKTANTELGHITEQITRIALAHGQIEFLVTHNDRQLFHILSNMPLQQRIGILFSESLAESLIEFQSDEKDLELYGWMGRPEAARTTNKYQYIFLNRRYIKDKFLAHAIREAYRGRIEQGRYPVIFLFMKMRPEDFDVNVHPQKFEVRFYNTNLIYSQVLAVLREKLLSTNLAVDASFSDPRDDTSSPRPATTGEPSRQKITDAMADFFKKYQNSPPQRSLDFPKPHRTHRPDIVMPQRHEDMSVPAADTGPCPFIQIHDSFIITQQDDGFDIIDQHALHERLIYEDLKKRIEANRLESQKLLLPESLELTDQQAACLQEYRSLLDKMGIDITPFGPKTWAVQSFPTLLSNIAIPDFIHHLLDLLNEQGRTLDRTVLIDQVLEMAACKAAIKAGKKLTNTEIRQLLEQKDQSLGTGHCPHGRPTTIHFSTTQIEKQFKRR